MACPMASVSGRTAAKCASSCNTHRAWATRHGTRGWPSPGGDGFARGQAAAGMSACSAAQFGAPPDVLAVPSSWAAGPGARMRAVVFLGTCLVYKRYFDLCNIYMQFEEERLRLPPQPGLFSLADSKAVHCWKIPDGLGRKAAGPPHDAAPRCSSMKSRMLRAVLDIVRSKNLPRGLRPDRPLR